METLNLKITPQEIKQMDTQACKTKLKQIDDLCAIVEDQIQRQDDQMLQRPLINQFLCLKEERRLVNIQLSIQLDPYTHKRNKIQ